MRSIGMDAHRSFAQVAILEGGRFTGDHRIELDHDAVVAFGQSLRAEDKVVLEATGNTAALVRLLAPFVARVVIANPLQVRAIAHARVKTDKVDARSLAQLHSPASDRKSGRRTTPRRTCGASCRSVPPLSALSGT